MQKQTILCVFTMLLALASAGRAWAEPRYTGTYQDGNAMVFVAPAYAVAGGTQWPIHNDDVTYRQWLGELGYIYTSADVQCYIPPGETSCGSNYFPMYGFIHSTWEMHTCVYNPWPFADCYTSVRELRGVTVCTDGDGDGYNVDGGDCGPADCDDTDPLVNPATPEICNGQDDNCNGQIDEGMTIAFYIDADADSYGNALISIQACSQPAGYVLDKTDCDDSDPTVNPGATDKNVDGLDQNCDGVDGPIRTTLHFPAIKDGPHADGLWKNFLSIQARDPSQPTGVTFLLHNSDGSLRLSVPDTTPVNGRLVKTPNWLMHGALNVEQFDGTVTVEADAPILGTINTIAPTDEAFDIYESPLAGTELFFPAAYENFANGNGFRNILHLQNISATPTVVTVHYIDDWNGTVTDTWQIPPYGEYERVIGQVFGGPFNGIIRVTATSEVAGMLRYEYMAANKVEATTLYESTLEQKNISFPFIYDGFGGNSNYYSIMNTSPVDATCSFSFYPNAGPGPVFTDGPVIIAPGARYTTTPSWARYGQLGHDFSGAIAGTCDTLVSAVTNVITPAVEGYNQYEAAVKRGTLYFSQVYDNLNGYSNEVHLFNTNDYPVNLTLQLFFTDGTLLGTRSVTLPGFGKYILQPHSMNAKAGLYQTNGSLTVTVANGERITGVLVYRKPTFISVYEAVSP